MGLEMVGKHHGHPSSLLGTSHSATHLLAEHISSASGSNTAIEPAITPIHQAKTIHFPIIPRRFDQALPASSFSRPNARQGRVKSYLHLILQIEVSAWQESEQISQVGGKLVPQVSLDQVMNG